MFSLIRNKSPLFEISSNQLIIYLSLLFTVLFNFPFLNGVRAAVFEVNDYSIGFLLSVPVLLFSLIAIFFSLLAIPLLFRPIAMIITVLSTFVFYGTSVYGVVFDYGMIQNTFETDVSEAMSYINVSAVTIITLIVVPVTYLIYQVKITYKPLPKELLSRLVLVVCLFATAAVIAKVYYADYAATGRNNRYLKKEIIQFQFVSSGFKFFYDEFLAPEKQFKLLDTTPSLINTGNKPKVTIVVVGETARAKNFEYNGYDRATNEYTRVYSPSYFSNVASCGTATAVSVPCMFSQQTRSNFSRSDTDNQQNLLDIAQLAGADVLWIDNNSGCKDVCNRVPSIQIDPQQDSPLCDGTYCYDEILVQQLKKKLANIHAQSTLIVLHMIGSHGPTYFKRYPTEAKKFVPDCPQSDIQNCSQQALINTYDNTILYSDLVNAQIIAALQSYSSSYDLSFIYVSDHGESLGESGAYLHGFPYALAPAEQTHVPMYFWSSHHQREFKDCLAPLSNRSLSHDNVFHSLINLTGLNTKAFDAQLNLFNSCQT